MGLDWRYDHPRDVFAEMAAVMPSLRNITWERLERENAVTYPCDGPDQPGQDVVFDEGFPTATGRGRSEEHTSELQSLMRISYAVFCLKKKNITNKKIRRDSRKEE